MKKLFIFCLMLCLCFTFSGCKDKTPPKPDEPYMTAVKDYISVYRLGETEKLEKLAPQAVIDKLTANSQLDMEKQKATITKDAEVYLNNMKSLYGDDFKLTVTVKQKEALGDEIQNVMKNQISTLYEISTEEIKEISMAEYEILYSSEKKQTKQQNKYWIVNINDNWYVCDSQGTFGISKFF